MRVEIVLVGLSMVSAYAMHHNSCFELEMIRFKIASAYLTYEQQNCSYSEDVNSPAVSQFQQMLSQGKVTLDPTRHHAYLELPAQGKRYCYNIATNQVFEVACLSQSTLKLSQ